MSLIETGGVRAEKKKGSVIETFKLLDKVGMAGGVGVFLVFGIPAALAIAGLSAVSFGLTEAGEKGVSNLMNKLRGKNR